MATVAAGFKPRVSAAAVETRVRAYTAAAATAAAVSSAAERRLCLGPAYGDLFGRRRSFGRCWGSAAAEGWAADTARAGMHAPRGAADPAPRAAASRARPPFLAVEPLWLSGARPPPGRRETRPPPGRRETRPPPGKRETRPPPLINRDGGKRGRRPKENEAAAVTEGNEAAADGPP